MNIKLLKKRKANVSKRGLYLQDKELIQSKFIPGEKYIYEIDHEKECIIIKPSSEGNTISKRKLKDGTLKPVIDIRDKQALALFDNYKELDIEIFEDKVIIVGKTKLVSIPIDYINDLPLFKVAEKLSKKKQILFKVASLFSGAGLMDLGFIKAGYDIEFALEIDSDACKTYQHNLGNHITNADITKYDKDLVPKVPIMIMGPPCQGFSNANRVTNFLDNPKNKLITHAIKTIKANSNCQVFVIENVPQILTAGEGAFFNEICTSLPEYHITSKVINSADMGDAQSRKRAIIIGCKFTKINLDKLKPIKIKRTVRDAFKGLNDQIYNQLDFSKSKPETIIKMSYVPSGGNIFDIPKHIRPKGVHSNAYKRLEWDKPSITIANPRKSNILHPEENRILSVRECARLFSVSDKFEFLGGLSSKQQQVANGVPVRLSYMIGTLIKKYIDLYNKNIQSMY